MAALLDATRANNLAVLGRLLASGVAPDASSHSGFTALSLAAKLGRVDAAKLLIGAGADVNRRAQDGATPLATAKDSGHDELVAVFEAAGAR